MHFHLLDHLGSSALDISAAGEALATRSFFPFGEAQEEVEHIPHEGNVYGFTGKEEDEDTGLHYFEARFYDAGVGRFMGVDPWVGDESDPQTLNKYSYVVNRPLVAIDPSGEVVEYVMRDLSLFPNSAESHSFLMIAPDDPELAGFGPQSTFLTLGGQREGVSGALVGEKNNADDIASLSNPDLIKIRTEIATPEGMTDAEFGNALIQAHESYNEKPEAYSVLSIGNGYNCHNYATTIVERAGGQLPNVNPGGWNPGLAEVIPGKTESEVPQQFIQQTQNRGDVSEVRQSRIQSTQNKNRNPRRNRTNSANK